MRSGLSSLFLLGVNRKEKIMGEIKKNKMKNKSSGNGRTISLKDSIGFKLPLIITLIFVVSLSLITAVAFFSSANKSVSENKEKIGWKANYLMATFQGISNQYYTAVGSTAEIKFVVEHLAGEDKGSGGKKMRTMKVRTVQDNNRIRAI